MINYPPFIEWSLRGTKRRSNLSFSSRGAPKVAKTCFREAKQVSGNESNFGVVLCDRKMLDEG